MDVFQEYLMNIEDGEKRAKLEEVLTWVGKTFPSLSPKIAWNQPMFTEHGTFILGLSVSKGHFAISPEAKGIAVFSDAIEKAGYSRGSNLFRIRWEEPVNYSLLSSIIQYNLEDKRDCATFWRR